MTEQEKIEMLLKPRYKVIADYPESPFKIGQVIDIAKEYPKDRFDWANDWYAKYPNIFKPLSWWEDRKPEEMPQFLKYKFMPDSKEKIIRVKKHFTCSQGLDNKHLFVSEDDFFSYSKSFPATESEYLQYHAQKSNVK